MSLLYSTRPCYGRNPRTGKTVGSRHRWEGATCKWCGRFKDEVRVPYVNYDLRVERNPKTHDLEWRDDAPTCELKSQFCDGKDVRLIQKIYRYAGRMIREGKFHWCKGCRGFMNGSFRYPKPNE